MDHVTFTLGGAPYTITTPLTLGQLSDCKVAVVLPTSDDPQEDMRRSFKRSVDLLVAGLRADYTDITAELLIGLRITDEEMNAATTAILVAAGLVRKKAESAPGEAPAPALAAE